MFIGQHGVCVWVSALVNFLLDYALESFSVARSSMWRCFSGWLAGNLAIHPAISRELTGRAEAYFWKSYLYACLLDKEQLVEQTSIKL